MIKFYVADVCGCDEATVVSVDSVLTDAVVTAAELMVGRGLVLFPLVGLLAEERSFSTRGEVALAASFACLPHSL